MSFSDPGRVREKNNIAMKHEVKTHWKGRMSFDAMIDDHTIRIDARDPLGDNTGPSPKKLLLASLAGCTGIDVVSLLEKMRAPVDSFEIDTEADLTDEHPKRYSEIRIIYRFYGKDLKKSKIEKAVQLSQEKYCGVSEMLRANSPIKYVIEYHEE